MGREVGNEGAECRYKHGLSREVKNAVSMTGAVCIRG